MKLQCDYCGSYFEDTETQCPNCGGTNHNIKRMVHGTPKTIEELQAWYEARNLPPSDVTRFFIGVNYKGPKAFGIYKEGNDFIVYKNKADGQRAVRYKGPDEAYAVNELYLRLKEEILNQKSQQLRKTSVTGKSVGNSTRSHKRNAKAIRSVVLASICTFLVPFFVGFIAFVSASTTERPNVSDYYYVDNNIYYYEGYSGDIDNVYKYRWWKYNGEDWEPWYSTDSNAEFPEGFTNDNSFSFSTNLAEYLIENGIATGDVITLSDKLDIYNSRAYIDAGNHIEPNKNSYYVCNGKTYFYLKDRDGRDYGDGDDTGWYIYDDGWSYCCAYDDKESVPEDLWYSADKYYVGSNYDQYTSGDIYFFNPGDVTEWATDFSETTWYTEAQKADELGYKAREEQRIENEKNNNWDDDDDYDDDDYDYDWDSYDSWDSGYTDWDSDW